jgi:hypothetical protein
METEKHIETIFDYDLSEGELKRFNITDPFLRGHMKIMLSKSPDDRYYTLGLLFAMRGDKRKAKKYWDKIEDKRMLSTLIQDF